MEHFRHGRAGATVIERGSATRSNATTALAGLVTLAFVTLLTLVVTAPDVTAAAARVRVGVLKFGTVSWELDVMQTHGLATREGVDLQVVTLASTNATTVALQGGAVDMIVTDWTWVSRQRAEGRPYTFAPYSLTVGGLIVRPDSGIRELADLRGKRLGVAGGPVDKSWLFFRAYGRRVLGEDLGKLVEPSFGGPPLLNELVLRGELPAVLNYWQYGARLKAAGMRELVSVADVLRALGVPGPLPLLGWAFDERWANANRATVSAFLRAAYAAKQILDDLGRGVGADPASHGHDRTRRAARAAGRVPRGHARAASARPRSTRRQRPSRFSPARAGKSSWARAAS